MSQVIGIASGHAFGIASGIIGGSVGNIIIGGVAVGTQGAGIYNTYTLAGGDDFNGPLNIMGESKSGGRYLVNTPSSAIARIPASPNNVRYGADPLHTGYLDANRGVPVGFTDMMVQSNSVLAMKCRVATGGESTLSNSMANLFTRIWSTPWLTFTPPAIIEFYGRFPTGMPTGIHPTFWIIQGDPANTQNGLEFDIAEGSSQYASFNQNTWGTVSGWGAGGTAGTVTQNQTFSLQSLSLYGSSYHLYTLVMDTSGASLYVDGTLAHTYSGDTTAAGTPYNIIASNVTYHDAWNGDAGFSQSSFNSAGNAGGVIYLDYFRIWIPNSKYPSQIVTPRASAQHLTFNYNSAISYTFPTANAIWGAGNFDSDYLQAIRQEDFEPGGDNSGSAIYLQFPAGLSLSGRTLSGSLTGSTNKPGRLNLIAIATKAGGSLNYTFQDYIDVGPNITTSTINITNGSAGSHDLYTECDCGTLLPKVIAVSGLPAGVTYDGVSLLSWGTSGYVNGTTPITITVTNASGQQATSTPNIVIASAGANNLTLDGIATSTSGSTASLAISLTTSNANDVLLLYAIMQNDPSTVPTITSVTDNGPGLTWTRRKRQLYGSANGNAVECWYAIAASAFNASITVNFSGVNANRLMAFGVSGANTSTPWDANASLPGSNSGGAGATTLAPSSALSTTSANTGIFTILRTSATAGTITVPTGFAAIGTEGGAEQIAWNTYTSTQSGISPQWTYTTAGTSGGIWDALVST